jgi:hypothetical protein
VLVEGHYRTQASLTGNGNGASFYIVRWSGHFHISFDIVQLK